MGWLKQIFSRRRRYDEIAESIREHLEEKIEDLMGDGLSREEANLKAQREFGNVTLIEERSREVWQWPMLETLFQDLRFGARMFAHVIEETGLHIDCRDHACAQHWRECGDLQFCGYIFPAASSHT